jgi:hypothetical protein
VLLVVSLDETSEKRSATGTTYPDMLEQRMWPKLKEDFLCKRHVQLDGYPLHMGARVSKWITNGHKK